MNEPFLSVRVFEEAERGVALRIHADVTPERLREVARLISDEADRQERRDLARKAGDGKQTA